MIQNGCTAPAVTKPHLCTDEKETAHVKKEPILKDTASNLTQEYNVIIE